MKKILFILGVLLSISSIAFASNYRDVSFYAKEIDYLSSKNIINGYGNGLFKPSEKITRAELVKMIVSATKKTKGYESYFSDVANNHWAKEYIDIAVANNYIKGDAEGTFRPDDNITYGEVATVLVRVMGKESEAEKLYLEWPENYMKEATYLNLFNGYRTNDLISINEARRDSVALMIYNMLNTEDTTTTTKSVDESEVIKINTSTNAYAGFVTAIVERRGVTNVKVKDNDDAIIQLPVYQSSDEPKIGSFIIYQLTKDEELKLCREIKTSEIDKSYITVDKVEDELVTLKGQSKLLDLDLDKYTLNGKTYKLNKITFFIIEIEDDEFKDYKIKDKDSLKLKKGDEIKFDEKYNICYVIREV